MKGVRSGAVGSWGAKVGAARWMTPATRWTCSMARAAESVVRARSSVTGAGVAGVMARLLEAWAGT